MGVLIKSKDNSGVVYFDSIPNAITLDEAIQLEYQLSEAIEKAKSNCVDCGVKTNERPSSGGERCSWGTPVVLCDTCWFDRLHKHGEYDDQG